MFAHVQYRTCKQAATYTLKPIHRGAWFFFFSGGFCCWTGRGQITRAINQRSPPVHHSDFTGEIKRLVMDRGQVKPFDLLRCYNQHHRWLNMCISAGARSYSSFAFSSKRLGPVQPDTRQLIMAFTPSSCPAQPWRGTHRFQSHATLLQHV